MGEANAKATDKRKVSAVHMTGTSSIPAPVQKSQTPARHKLEKRRPVLVVLAGVNGAGKSSIGGHLLTQADMSWFNPDTYARELVQRYGHDPQQANIAAWNEGVRRLDHAMMTGADHAFETTLGGHTIVKKLIAAAATHDVMVWFCGLRDAQQHIERVRQRVSHGGHDIPEERIRERCQTSVLNLLRLMPHLTQLRVYDNSVQVAAGSPLPEPRLVLYIKHATQLFPRTLHEARDTPDWAKPIVEAAYQASAQAAHSLPDGPHSRR